MSSTLVDLHMIPIVDMDLIEEWITKPEGHCRQGETWDRFIFPRNGVFPSGFPGGKVSTPGASVRQHVSRLESFALKTDIELITQAEEEYSCCVVFSVGCEGSRKRIFAVVCYCNDMDSVPDSFAEDGDKPKPVRATELRARDEKPRVGYRNIMNAMEEATQQEKLVDRESNISNANNSLVPTELNCGVQPRKETLTESRVFSQKSSAPFSMPPCSKSFVWVLAPVGERITPIRQSTRQAAKKLHASLSEKGLALLVNHGIPGAKIQEAYKKMNKFCKLPQDLRNEYAISENCSEKHGYILPERDRFCSGLPTQHCFNIQDLEGKMPEKDIPGFTEVITSLADDFKAVSKTVLQFIAIGLDRGTLTLLSQDAENGLEGKSASCVPTDNVHTNAGFRRSLKMLPTWEVKRWNPQSTQHGLLQKTQHFSMTLAAEAYAF
ncbi:hypothetical protein AAG570_007625 [Ranatra chinensis]|uniref:Non-haem dioxygenase N-terminal domain-containing protein n=1 Tax=Ranatra chinensis TaxID=642074 RepID=A0ABD0XU38_9HEMI